MTRFIRLLLLPLAAIALLVGCSADPPPAPLKQVDVPAGDTQLRDAIQKPIDRAKSVEGKLQDEKEKQDKQVQDQGG